MVKTHDWIHLPILCLIVTLAPNLYGADLRKDLEKELRNLYEGKKYIIRNFYTGDRLKYSSDGILVSGGDPGIWPVNGFIKLHKVKIKKDKIELDGKRLLWAYDQQKNEEVNYISNSIRIEIGPFDSVPDISSANRIIYQIFMKATEFAAAVPYYWRKYVYKTFVGGNISESIEGRIQTPIPGEITADFSYIHPQDDFQEPKVLSEIAPPYTKLGRQVRISGVVKLEIIISKEGVPTVTNIIKPIGLDLEESAIETISKWQFSPAYYKGKPVSYPGMIEIRFDIF